VPVYMKYDIENEIQLKSITEVCLTEL